ncbi:hypothetical protein D3C84_1003860 [compost metagenome]
MIRLGDLERPVGDLGVMHQATEHGDNDDRQQYPDDNGFEVHGETSRGKQSFQLPTSL